MRWSSSMSALAGTACAFASWLDPFMLLVLRFVEGLALGGCRGWRSPTFSRGDPPRQPRTGGGLSTWAGRRSAADRTAAPRGSAGRPGRVAGGPSAGWRRSGAAQRCASYPAPACFATVRTPAPLVAPAPWPGRPSGCCATPSSWPCTASQPGDGQLHRGFFNAIGLPADRCAVPSAACLSAGSCSWSTSSVSSRRPWPGAWPVGWAAGWWFRGEHWSPWPASC